MRNKLIFKFFSYIAFSYLAISCSYAQTHVKEMHEQNKPAQTQETINNANNAPANTDDGVRSFGSEQVANHNGQRVVIRRQDGSPIGGSFIKTNNAGALMGTVRSSF